MDKEALEDAVLDVDSCRLCLAYDFRGDALTLRGWRFHIELGHAGDQLPEDGQDILAGAIGEFHADLIVLEDRPDEVGLGGGGDEKEGDERDGFSHLSNILFGNALGGERLAPVCMKGNRSDGRVRKLMDLRVQKTRRDLADALIELMISQGYEKTTVQNILDRARVGRATFYAHFRDKESLLKASIDNLAASLETVWRQTLEAEGRPQGQLGFVLPFLRHVDSGRRIWYAVAGRESGDIVERHFGRMLADLTRKDLEGRNEGDLEVAVQFVVGALMRLMFWWLDRDIRLSADELNDQFLGLVLPGLAG
jgi:AcrR family transcriptional regulator